MIVLLWQHLTHNASMCSHVVNLLILHAKQFLKNISEGLLHACVFSTKLAIENLTLCRK
jgi:hypothetical protein